MAAVNLPGKSYLQAYVFNLLDKKQQDDLNNKMKKYDLAQPLESSYVDGKYLVFALFEVVEPTKINTYKIKAKKQEPKPVSEMVVGKKSEEDIGIFIENSETEANKILKEVKNEAIT